MTPKEKAEELFNKFQQDYFILVLPNGRKMYTSEIKYCAMIAVDEILELTKRNIYNPFDWNEITGVRYDKYWQEVKEEIENL